MRALILLFLLAACSERATGPEFQEQDNTRIIVYSDYVRSGGLYSRNGTWDIKNDGLICELHDKAYFIAKKGELSFNGNILKLDHVSYIRIDSTVFNGLTAVGNILSSKNSITFTEVPKNQAVRELQGMRQDCI